MTLIHHIIVLALIQGITEFLPVSSSGHLILVSKLTPLPDQTLVVDIALHVGTLAAVMVYFHRECWAMVLGVLNLLLLRGGPEAKLAIHVVIATLPIIPAALYLKDYVAGDFRQGVALIAWTTLGFGILLYAADRLGLRIRRVEHMTIGAALFIGLAQILALVPGTSRSGITMTAARFLGFERIEAARFSLVLSIPVIIGAGTLAGAELYQMGNAEMNTATGLAIVFSFGAALIAIAVMMRWLGRASFTPFVIYRICLGAGLLYWVYG
ncbi:MAG: undecaprenyl-diphosphate phosphatase [Alphaproteobacteria bacterium]